MWLMEEEIINIEKTEKTQKEWDKINNVKLQEIKCSEKINLIINSEFIVLTVVLINVLIYITVSLH
jgi:hypothetical protein